MLELKNLSFDEDFLGNLALATDVSSAVIDTYANMAIVRQRQLMLAEEFDLWQGLN
jgi:hypothetical protein